MSNRFQLTFVVIAFSAIFSRKYDADTSKALQSMNVYSFLFTLNGEVKRSCEGTYAVVMMYGSLKQWFSTLNTSRSVNAKNKFYGPVTRNRSE